MDITTNQSCTAFAGHRRLASGRLSEVALAVRAASREHNLAPILIFDDATGRSFDIDTRGSEAEVLARLAQPVASEPAATRGRGRPRLGMVSREVTLLPRHWDWLAAQPGGASVTLRRLVEDARRHGAGRDRLRLAQEAAYHFMSAIAGDLPGFEQAARALFAGNGAGFRESMAAWPEDIRLHAQRLAAAAAPGQEQQCADE